MPSPAAIATVRHALGLTQAELAQALALHTLTVSKWERAIRVPSARDAAVLNGLAKLDDAAVAEVGAAVKVALEEKGGLAAYHLLLDAACPKGAP